MICPTLYTLSQPPRPYLDCPPRVNLFLSIPASGVCEKWPVSGAVTVIDNADRHRRPSQKSAEDKPVTVCRINTKPSKDIASAASVKKRCHFRPDEPRADSRRRVAARHQYTFVLIELRPQGFALFGVRNEIYQDSGLCLPQNKHVRRLAMHVMASVGGRRRMRGTATDHKWRNRAAARPSE